MTTEELEQRLARLEDRLEEASARLMVSEGLLSSIARLIPHAADVIADFKIHQDLLEAVSLNETAVSDTWLSKLQAARELMMYRLSLASDRNPNNPGTLP